MLWITSVKQVCSCRIFVDDCYASLPVKLHHCKTSSKCIYYLLFSIHSLKVITLIELTKLWLIRCYWHSGNNSPLIVLFSMHSAQKNVRCFFKLIHIIIVYIWNVCKRFNVGCPLSWNTIMFILSSSIESVIEVGFFKCLKSKQCYAQA